MESGPADADGFTWYQVVDTAGQGGWAADGDGDDPWLSPIRDLASARPILTMEYGSDVVGPINPPATTVLDDGSVIVTQGAAGEWTVRQLSQAGISTSDHGGSR